MANLKEKEQVQETLKEITKRMQNGEPINKDYSNDDLRVLYTLAHGLYEAEEYEQAQAIFQQLATSQPFTQKYWLGLGGCSQMTKHYVEALKAWGMAALIEGTDPIPHYHAAECYLALNDYTEGLKAIRATKSRLTEAHEELRQKVEDLESSWNKQVEAGA